MNAVAARSKALAAGEGDARWFIQNLITVKLTGADTDGRFSLVEALGARGDMLPLHVHREDDETFVVLEGELTLYVGEDIHTAGPGAVLHAPRGIPHVYRVESETARWLVISVPAAFAELVLEASEPAAAPTLPTVPPSVSPLELTAIAGRYGVEILGPPGALPAQ
jgi:quercetin dioxygenase-like cupin family protein